jgi:D-glycero-D-manno-heptose 1,7-bisphosphate phosphatase
VKKVVFLDRDGVINNNALYYTHSKEDFVINTGVLDALKLLSQRGFEFVVITNQGGISKGLFSKMEVETVHSEMKRAFSKKGISLLEVYFCPHHSEVENCLCRKPQTIMVEKAMARFNIDPTHSYFIGDQKKDEETALACNITPIRITSNTDLRLIVDLIK